MGRGAHGGEEGGGAEGREVRGEGGGGKEGRREGRQEGRGTGGRMVSPNKAFQEHVFCCVWLSLQHILQKVIHHHALCYPHLDLLSYYLYM